MAEKRIQTLEELIARQSSQIEALEKQLAEAEQQVQDIAVKASECDPPRHFALARRVMLPKSRQRPSGMNSDPVMQVVRSTTNKRIALTVPSTGISWTMGMPSVAADFISADEMCTAGRDMPGAPTGPAGP